MTVLEHLAALRGWLVQHDNARKGLHHTLFLFQGTSCPATMMRTFSPTCRILSQRIISLSLFIHHLNEGGGRGASSPTMFDSHTVSKASSPTTLFVTATTGQGALPLEAPDLAVVSGLFNVVLLKVPHLRSKPSLKA